MKLTKVHLFVLLLLALVLCSFLGGACGGGSLEGFNMPSDSSPYKGKGQYSDQFSSYSDLYSANKKFSKGQDALYDRKDKPLAPNSSSQQDDGDSKYAPFSGDDNNAKGIPSSQILPGQEDLYILKSSVVPPVCPVCPSVKCNNGKGGHGGGHDTPAKCPPCPPCARCPEPSFECKKVPNYNLANNNALPRPVLSSFSQFGL
jgi:hypothetical protein